MSYNFGAARGGRGLPGDGLRGMGAFGATDAANAARAALQEQFAYFETVMRQGMADIAGRAPSVAAAIPQAITSMRNGLNKLLSGGYAGTADSWALAASRLIQQVRDEAPWYSNTTMLAAATDLATVARHFGEEAVRATGITKQDVKDAAKEAASTVKWVAGAGIVLGLGYLVFMAPKGRSK